MTKTNGTAALRGALAISGLALAAAACSEAPDDNAAQDEADIDMSFAEVSATGEEIEVAPGGESCNAPTARRWIGWPASGDVMAQMREAVDPIEVNFVQADEEPGSGNDERLNVLLDADGNITAAGCG